MKESTVMVKHKGAQGANWHHQESGVLDAQVIGTDVTKEPCGDCLSNASCCTFLELVILFHIYPVRVCH